MPVSGKFELNVTTSTQEEMDRIAEAIYSGFAENIIKQHVLWSQFMQPAGAPVATRPAAPEPQLTRATTRSKAGAQPSVPVKKERATGVIGRGRMGRTQK